MVGTLGCCYDFFKDGKAEKSKYNLKAMVAYDVQLNCSESDLTFFPFTRLLCSNAGRFK